ncbi:uncharacterized protein RHOBADRAFT_65452 [Rhodotorula graminis WP1]|uniref:Uncharacterized protein n=1 Tax=Rhodotorula graminis (strain WP1) TaxID=578459 RepID=A0A0P9EME9_RHOGW|nr:uncharacterized protein RHOBADRAFT_65452 [Rhodotorula graminis WP1]KPV72958.1 hypothetical protein RHOBADRAFT_65452 [Rhodotorula graminis WP1]
MDALERVRRKRCASAVRGEPGRPEPASATSGASMSPDRSLPHGARRRARLALVVAVGVHA